MRMLAKTMLTMAIIMAQDGFAQDPPVNATLVGHWDEFSGDYGDVWGDGNYAYLAHYGDAGIHIIDISDPANPVVASHYRVAPPNNNASAQDVKVHDGLMFIGLEFSSADQVEIVDVRDPYSPQTLTTVAVGQFSPFIHNVFYDNGYLYMVDSESPQVAIVDLTAFDPDNPPATITTALWIISGIGNDFVHDITVKNGRLYACAWDHGLKIYDVSDVANQMPQLIGETPDGGNNTHSCWPSDNGDFVVTGEERENGGIKVYRITDNGNWLTLELTDSRSLPLSQAFSVHNQTLVGYRVYNSWYQAGLQVFDIDPTTGLLEFVASYDTYPGSPNWFNGNWGVNPFLGNQTILLSDIANGLFIVALDLPGCQYLAGDVNGNDEVNVVDLTALVLWLAEGQEPAVGCDCPPLEFPFYAAADVNGNCEVNVLDVTYLVNYLVGAGPQPVSCPDCPGGVEGNSEQGHFPAP